MRRIWISAILFLLLSAPPSSASTPPGITVASPLAQGYSYTEGIFIGFEVSDSGSGVAGHRAYLDGSEVNRGLVLDLSNFALGEHELTVVAMDNLSNNATETVTFQVIDDVPPVVEILAPTAGEYLSTEDLPVSFFGSDQKGLASVNADVDGNPITGPRIDLASLTPGEHALTVTALDTSGNVAAETVLFIVIPVQVDTASQGENLMEVEISATTKSEKIQGENNFDFVVHVKSDTDLRKLASATGTTFAEGYTVLSVSGGAGLNIKVDVGVLESREYSFTLTSIGGVNVQSNTLSVTVFVPG